MKDVSIRSLLISISIFTICSFVVHSLLNPEPTLIGAAGYAVFSGCIFGIVFYLIEKKRKSSGKK